MPCQLCDDTGWRAVLNGSSRRVTRCECWHRATGTRLLGEARIPKRYAHCDLASFRDYGNESLQRARALASRFADEFPAVDRGLFLLGAPGVGKTHLAVAVLKQVVLTRGAHGLFYDTRDLLREIRNTYNREVRTAEIEVLRPVMQAELLVLDDLGAEKTSEWVEETLNLIVNTRYNERRATILTSNYEDRPDISDPDSLLFRIGFRMRSRLHEMCNTVELDGGDFRQAPPNPADDDLLALWKQRPKSSRTPPRRPAPVRAQLRDGGADLKWPGGRAGN
jgi:DNA replication protein DnaC